MAVYPHLLHAVAVMLMLLGASGSVYDKVASKSDYSEGVLNHTKLNSSELQKAMSNVSVEILSVETLADSCVHLACQTSCDGRCVLIHCCNGCTEGRGCKPSDDWKP
mmetsp:Transcript_68375/g.120732  ORF Transcript_68375/g.120732 Transcript_68375/m.120732 type:complete len:107 (+) Transcript_68375:94-414(+)